MDSKYIHFVDGDKFIIEMRSNRFTQDLISHISEQHPYSDLSNFSVIEFNLEQVKMIDSTSIGYLFELHKKLQAEEQQRSLIISLGNNHELKDLLHRFQVDLLLNIN